MRRKENKTELVGVGDYLADSSQKSYIRVEKDEPCDNTEDSILCATSDNNFFMEGIDQGELAEYSLAEETHKVAAIKGNIKNQPKWYAAMANEFQRIGNGARWTRDNWGGGDIHGLNVNGIEYTATNY